VQKNNNFSIWLKNIFNHSGLYLTLGGCLLLVGLGYQIRYFYEGNIQYHTVYAEEIKAKPRPIQLKISRLGIDISVISGGFKDNDWILSNYDALYLPSAGQINEGYNTIIYAHNWEGLFANLYQASIGDKVTIRDQFGVEYSYEVYAVEYVFDTDVNSLQTDKKDVLTLFTCNGWFDNERIIVRAKKM
jgi:LPXTG-site transpeptidase (sortase) family protein